MPKHEAHIRPRRLIKIKIYVVSVVIEFRNQSRCDKEPGVTPWWAARYCSLRQYVASFSEFVCVSCIFQFQQVDHLVNRVKPQPQDLIRTTSDVPSVHFWMIGFAIYFIENSEKCSP
jgi:hypothetical protein